MRTLSTDTYYKY